jgi:hypothetical protein
MNGNLFYQLDLHKKALMTSSSLVYWYTISEHDADTMVAKWKSVHEHVHNNHDGFDTEAFPRCVHDETVARDWLIPGVFFIFVHLYSIMFCCCNTLSFCCHLFL